MASKPLDNKLESLYKASFRGVSLFILEDNTKKGQKAVTHEYPNSDVRDVEELGKIPPIIDIKCLTTNYMIGSTTLDFVEARDKLEEALDKGGIGNLVHQHYGSLNVKVGEYSISSSIKEVGKSIFSIKFYYCSDGEIIAKPEEVKTDAQKKIADDEIKTNVGKRYVEPVNSGEKIRTKSFFEGLLDGIADLLNDLSDFNELVASATDDLFNALATANGIADLISNTINGLNQLVLDAKTLTSYFENILNRKFFKDESKEKTTVQRQREESNKELIDEQITLLALSGYLNSSTLIDFTTAEEIEKNLKLSDEIFEKIFSSDDQDEKMDVRDEMMKLKIQSRNLINLKLQNVWKVVEKKSNLTSLSLQTYNYYESLDNIDDIVGINNDLNSSNFKGNLKIIKL